VALGARARGPVTPLVTGIAELGVDVYATVYIDDGSNSAE